MLKLILIGMFLIKFFRRRTILRFTCTELSVIALVTVPFFGIAAAVEEKNPSGTVTIEST